jgi:ribosomal protein L10
VLKNTLARRAVKGTPFEKLSDQMAGPLMYGIAQDPVAGAKVLAAFAKDNEKFVIKGGVMANALMSAKDIKTLATMPSREELLAKLVGTMQAPVVTFRAYLERGAGQVRPHPRRGARCAGKESTCDDRLNNRIRHIRNLFEIRR